MSKADFHRTAPEDGSSLFSTKQSFDRGAHLDHFGARRCAGARLARKLGLLASRPTLLRSLRQKVHPCAAAAPRVLGLDEWALKKGHRYGTILCDLEQRRVIDLLPNRNTQTVAAWLREHPSVQVISRDRASSSADAIAKGAPEAVQVADRWHLLNNLHETLVRCLERHRRTMSEVVRQMASKAAPPSTSREQQATPTAALRRTLEKREDRLTIYQELTGLLRAGISQSEASRQLHLSLRTVQRWLACGVFPERKHRVFPSIVDTYGPHLEKRYQEGFRKIRLLWQELREHGFEGQCSTVRAWLRQRFGAIRNAKTTPVTKRSVPIGYHRIAWLMLKAKPGRNRFLEALYRASPEIAEIAHTARGLFEIIRTRDAAAWPAWLEAAEHSPYARFARRLRRDQHAITATLELPWSHGWWRDRSIA